MDVKRIVLAAGTVLALAACGGSGGSGTVTLHGTFTDSADTSSGSACADQVTLNGAAITVAVDNVSAGSAPVSWSGNPVQIGTFIVGGEPVYGCTGTWSVTMPSAHIGYALGVTGLGGVSGSVTVSVADAGKPIPLDDNTTNDQGGSILEVSS